MKNRLIFFLKELIALCWRSCASATGDKTEKQDKYKLSSALLEKCMEHRTNGSYRQFNIKNLKK